MDAFKHCCTVIMVLVGLTSWVATGIEKNFFDSGFNSMIPIGHIVEYFFDGCDG